MKRIALAVVLLAVSLAAAAAVVNFSWTNATQNTDGTAISASGPGSLTATTVDYGPCNASKTDLASITASVPVAEPATAIPAPPNLAPGSWCARSHHTNTYGVDSDFSAVVVKEVAAPKPNKPTGFTWG